MRQGISIKSTIGIGDGLQFTSLPENYFRATGEKLVDVSEPWFFDHNPYVVRGVEAESVREMWNFGPRQWDLPILRSEGVYLSNAEIFAALFGVPVTLNRPRLYQHEDYPFAKRSMILLQTVGKSHGRMPEKVLQHVLRKYGPTGRLYHIGDRDDRMACIPRFETPTLWALAAVIAQAQMLICLDSGPSWIAACYPDVLVKKLRTRPDVGALKDWVPLAVGNVHSHWDDRCHQIFNVSEHDVGFTQSYRRI